jgi:hypothetical protein
MKIKTVKKILLIFLSVVLFLVLGYSLYSQDLLLNKILVNILRVSFFVYLTVFITSRLFLLKERTFLTIVELIVLIGFQFLLPLNILFQFIYLALFTIFSYNLIDNSKDILFSDKKRDSIDYKSRVKANRKKINTDIFNETLKIRFEKKLKEAQKKFEFAYIIKNYTIEDKSLMKNKGKIIKFDYLFLTEKGVQIFEIINDLEGDLYALGGVKDGKWLLGQPNKNQIKQIINPIRLLEGKTLKLIEKITNSEYSKKHSILNENKIYKNIIFNNEVDFCLNKEIENVSLIREEEFEDLIDKILSNENILREKELLGLYYELI